MKTLRDMSTIMWAKKSNGMDQRRWQSIIPKPIDIFALNIAQAGNLIFPLRCATAIARSYDDWNRWFGLYQLFLPAISAEYSPI
jgi:hypothetical protein